MTSVLSGENTSSKPSFRRSIVDSLPKFYRDEIQKAEAAGDCVIIDGGTP